MGTVKTRVKKSGRKEFGAKAKKKAGVDRNKKRRDAAASKDKDDYFDNWD